VGNGEGGREEVKGEWGVKGEGNRGVKGKEGREEEGGRNGGGGGIVWGRGEGSACGKCWDILGTNSCTDFQILLHECCG
jgi:hypothetical protein